MQRSRSRGHHAGHPPKMRTRASARGEMLSPMPRSASGLNCSPEAARSLAKRLRLPRQLANDVKALVVVDVAVLAHKPMPAPVTGG
jgi:hypothetical protein